MDDFPSGLHWRSLLMLHLLILLVMLPLSVAHAQPLQDLLSLIEQHNPELQQQRRLLDTTAADRGDSTPVLHILQEQERAWWRYFRLRARAGTRLSPGQDGSGIDSRAALEFVMPLADDKAQLALAKERLRQRRDEHRHAKSVEQQRLTYEQQRAVLQTAVMQQLAELATTQTKLVTTQETLLRYQHRQTITVKRVQSGMEHRPTLWALQDEIAALKEQRALLASALKQQRTALAMLAGEQWQAALAMLQQRVDWFPPPVAAASSSTR